MTVIATRARSAAPAVMAWRGFEPAAAAGLLDSLAPLGYLLVGDALQVEILAIAGKLVLVASARDGGRLCRTDIQFVAVTLALCAIGTLTDAAGGTVSLEATSRYLAFALSIALTLRLVRFGDLRRYCRWLAAVPVGAAALHLGLVETGSIEFASGRYVYLGNAHPNLGGEIAAVAALAAVIGFGSPLRLLAAGILLASAVFMASRSAVLVIAAAMMVIATQWLWRGGVSRIATSIGLAALALLLFRAQAEQVAHYVVDGILLADDPGRGFGSGFSGRAERWSLALQAFEQNPLIGIGIGIYGADLAPSPHDAFLFGLAQHGLPSILFWLPLGYRLWRAAAASPWVAATLLTGTVLLVANDRFVNLNLYPFAYYVMILRAPSSPAPDDADAADGGG